MVVVQAMFRGMTARRLFKSKKQEMLVLAAARAAEAKRQAEEAKRRQEEARIAAEQARRVSIARAAVEDDRARMDEKLVLPRQRRSDWVRSCRCGG